MECIVLYDFKAQGEDELSINKGSIVKALETSTKDWVKVELNGREGVVPANYLKWSKCEWYRPDLKSSEAKEELSRLHYDGAFFVILSESSPGDFMLCVKEGSTVTHHKILRDGAGKYFLWLVKFYSINELVEYHRKSSICRGRKVVLKDAPERTYVALYDFAGEEGELSFKKGDIIQTSFPDDDEGWMKGNDLHGNTGIFPKNRVTSAHGN